MTTEINLPDSAEAATKLGALRNELRLLETRRWKIDEELTDVEFAAVALLDADAIARRKELTDQRAACDRRIADLQRGIASGDVHVKRLSDAEREAERKQWQARADDLRADQAKAATVVDKALAKLEEAWADYLQTAGERGDAMRKAGLAWSNSYLLRHLEQAVFAGAPRIATQLRLPRMLRPAASSLKDLVR